MKIQKVVIEGFHNVTRKVYDLADVNYLYGRNGSGKSTVLQAIQLGLLGYVPGTNKTKQSVFSHSNNHTMAVKLILDDNGQQVTIQRVWTKSKGSVSENIEVTPEGYEIEWLTKEVELPLFNFDEFTHMTPNGLKDWFINYLPKSSFKTDWYQALKESLSDLPDNIVDEKFIEDSVASIKDLHLEGVEEIRSANTFFKSQLSFMKSELQRKTGTIQSLVHYDDFEATVSESELLNQINDIDNRILSASHAQENAKRAVSIQLRMQSVEAAKKSLEERDFVTEIEKLTQDQKDLETSIDDKDYEISKLSVEHDSYNKIINSKGICPFTNESCGKISDTRDKYITRQKEIMENINAIRSELDTLKNSKQDLDKSLRSLRELFQNLCQDAKMYDSLKMELDSIPKTSVVEDIEALKAESASLKEAYGKAVANKKYEELNNIVLQDKYRIENEIECLKIWEKLTGVNGLQAKGDYNPFDEFSGCINKVLRNFFNNETAVCKFASTDKSNSFSFGIERDGTYVPYTLLSSGEKCLFVLALYIGLLQYTKSPLRLVLIDDFLDHLDDENFKTVFEVISLNNVNQYVFAGVKPVSCENVKIINLN